MPGYDAAKATEKQIRRAQNASTDYKDGVLSVTESPMAKAKKKKEKFKTNLNAAIDNGKWEAGLDSVSVEEWRELTAGKGAERYGSGVAAAEPKTRAFHEELAAFMVGHKAKIDAMPDATAEQRLAKMTENARGMAKFQRTRRRR